MMLRSAMFLFWRIETSLALLVAWILVFRVPFRWTAKLIGQTRAAETAAPSEPSPQGRSRAIGVARRIDWICPKMPFRTTCLVRAIGGWLLLKRRGVESTVRFGVTTDETGLKAHAWLLVGSHTLLGGDEAVGYRPLADIGA